MRDPEFRTDLFRGTGQAYQILLRAGPAALNQAWRYLIAAMTRRLSLSEGAACGTAHRRW